MLVAITGTIGAGKSTVADYLVEEHGFSFASGSQIIAHEIKERGLKLSRDNMHDVANEIREESPTELIRLTMEEVADQDRAGIGFVRSKNSVLYIRENNPDSILLGVDAPVILRYKRVQKQKEYESEMTLKEFKAFEAKEMTSDDPDKQNISYCLQQCDHVIINDGSLNDLYKKVDQVLGL